MPAPCNSIRMILNDCPVFVKVGGIIKPVDVYAEFASEIISNFLI